MWILTSINGNLNYKPNIQEDIHVVNRIMFSCYKDYTKIYIKFKIVLYAAGSHLQGSITFESGIGLSKLLQFISFQNVGTCTK